MKRQIIALTAFAMLIIAGCGGGEDDASPTSPFIGGTSGLLVSFENSPPAEVYDGGDFPFDIVVKLKNSGEWDVPKDNVQVKITGVRAEQFGLTDADLVKNAPDDLIAVERDPTGRMIESPPVIVEFTNLNHANPITGNELSYPIRADVCYDYGTTAVTQLCIRQNILDPKTGGICEISGTKDVQNSGGPVQVRNLVESARSSSKIGFTFNVDHAGTGDIYEKETACDKDTRASEDRVFISVDAGVEGLSCTGIGDGNTNEGYIKLYGGSKSVTCTLSLENPGDYKLPVTIDLEYGYEVGQSTQILVKHSGE